MKRHITLAVVLAILVGLAVPVFAGGREDDLQVIKRAVKGTQDCESGKPVKWFRVLITDHKSGKDVVKVNLPVSVAKLLAGCARDKHRRAGRSGRDFAAALKDLKKMGPLTLVEIAGDDAKVKIWLE
jgi:hypothetical protein